MTPRDATHRNAGPAVDAAASVVRPCLAEGQAARLVLATATAVVARMLDAMPDLTPADRAGLLDRYTAALNAPTTTRHKEA